MNSIDLIRDNLMKSRDRVLAKIDEMQDHALVFPTPSGGCHTLWILGHLAYIEGLVIHQFMVGQTNPLADWEETFDGDEVSDRPDLFPDFGQTLQTCRNLRNSTLERLSSLDEGDLDQPSEQCPESAIEMFGTYRLCFQFVSDHWYMHRGQLANCRRAAGVDRMWY